MWTLLEQITDFGANNRLNEGGNEVCRLSASSMFGSIHVCTHTDDVCVCVRSRACDECVAS